MAEFFLLGFKVFLGVWAGRDFAGDALHHAHSRAFQSLNLVGIV
jgi:hypothetical protein